MNKFRKIISLLLVLMFILSGLPAEIKAFAAEEIELEVSYNPVTYQYEVSYPLPTAPYSSVLTYHDPVDKSLKTIDGTYKDGKVVVYTDFAPDHIYDLSLEIFRLSGDSVASYQGKTYYLADITFTGESFNEMAKMKDIEDIDPILEPDGSISFIEKIDRDKSHQCHRG